jgi:hypothetical protein
MIRKEFHFKTKLHDPVLIIPLYVELKNDPRMNSLIANGVWVDVTDDESIDESKTFNWTYSFNWYFFLSPILQKRKFR